MKVNQLQSSRFERLVYEVQHTITRSFIDNYFQWIFFFLISLLVGWFEKKPIIIWIVIVLIVVVVLFCFLMGNRIKKRAILSDQKIITAFSDAFEGIPALIDRDGFAQSISNNPPIIRIRFEYNLPSLLHLASVFSKALNHLRASKNVFSEDDLELIRFWIQEDSELRTTLKNLEEIQESSISTFFEVLFDKSFLSDFQRDQLLHAFIGFTGTSSKLDSIEHKIHTKSQEE